MAKQKSRRNEQNPPSWEGQSRSGKRERFIDDGPRRKNNKGLSLYIVGVGALLIAIVVGFVTMEQSAKGSSAGGGGGGSSSASAAVTAVDGQVLLPVSNFAGPQARYYTYRTAQGKTIPFFVMKSSDGVIRAAYDACDVCFTQKKGYRQEGDQMVCNNCGQRFPSVRINIEVGGCNPSPLVREVKGDNVVITEKDLNDGVRYF